MKTASRRRDNNNIHSRALPFSQLAGALAGVLLFQLLRTLREALLSASDSIAAELKLISQILHNHGDVT